MTGPTNDSFTVEVDFARFAVRASRPMVEADGCGVWLTGFLAFDDGCAAPRLVRAWADRGAGFAWTIHGQFAGVIIDPVRRRVTLFQDPLGLRTLYYSIEGRRLVVSSGLERLWAERERDVDAAYFADLLCDGRPPADRTPLMGVSKLRRGASVTIDASGCSMSAPWTPAPAVEFRGDTEHRLRELIDEAVAAASPAKGCMICELSGGLDSSTVAATLTAMGARPVALTLTSGAELMGDDDRYAEEMVAILGFDWRRLDLDLYPTYSQPPNRFLGEPGDEPHQAIQAAYRRIVEAEGARVVLTGSGGDVILGYGGMPPIHLADDLARGRPFSAIRVAREWSAGANPDRPWTHFLYHYGVKPAWRHWRGFTLSDHDQRFPPHWVCPNLATLASERRPQNSERELAPSHRYLWDAVRSMAATDAACAFRQELTAETRHPLLHLPLVEFMIGLDWRLRCGSGIDGTNRDRVLQRRALADRLPPSVVARATKGSDQPLRERVLMRSRGTLQELLRDSRLVARGWVDARGWADQVARAPFGVFDGLGNFDSAITAEMWLRTLELPRAPEPILTPVLEPAMT